MRKCGECAFFKRYRVIGQPHPDVYGECRRFPPLRILAITVGESPAGWAQVIDTDWCGEFALRPRKKGEKPRG